MIVKIPFKITSPTVTDLVEKLSTSGDFLLDVDDGLEIILDNVREDLYNQFDEKQNTWTKNAKYTINKKERLGADERIMHESKIRGQRLRDEYRKIGIVANRTIRLTYPSSKPYSKLLDKGGVIQSDDNAKRSARARAIERQNTQKYYDSLDDEFFRAMRGK